MVLTANCICIRLKTQEVPNHGTDEALLQRPQGVRRNGSRRPVPLREVPEAGRASGTGRIRTRPPNNRDGGLADARRGGLPGGRSHRPRRLLRPTRQAAGQEARPLAATRSPRSSTVHSWGSFISLEQLADTSLHQLSAQSRLYLFRVPNTRCLGHHFLEQKRVSPQGH